MGVMIVIDGSGEHIYGILQERLLQSSEEALADMFNESRNSFGDDWKLQKKMEHEDKVKLAQSYKKKNQHHPAFRK